MTTRHGEPIEEEPQTVADILRPLAEAMIWPSCTCGRSQDGWRTGSCILHSGSPRSVLDPRFEALRLMPVEKMHMVASTSKGNLEVCLTCGASWQRGKRPRDEVRVDASMEAILEAAAAYDFGVLGEVLRAIEVAFFHHKDPKEAAARALVAAVGDETARAATGIGGP